MAKLFFGRNGSIHTLNRRSRLSTGNALVGYLIAMAAIETTLNQRAWWKTHTTLRSEADIIERLQHYETSIRQAYFVIFVSCFEWVVRNILVLLDPVACERDLGEYKSVYDALLARLKLQELTPIFDVARNLRNALYNNGIYCNPRGTDSPRDVYRGQSLHFVHGASIDMATELSFQLMEDLILAARKIVDAPVVTRLSKAPFRLTTGKKLDPRKIT